MKKKEFRENEHDVVRLSEIETSAIESGNPYRMHYQTDDKWIDLSQTSRSGVIKDFF